MLVLLDPGVKLEQVLDRLREVLQLGAELVEDFARFEALALESRLLREELDLELS